MLPFTAGARPGKINMMSRPNSAISRLLPERKPSPTPTSNSNEPTPQAMPNMVRNERSLWAQRLRKICAKMSKTVRITGLSDYEISDICYISEGCMMRASNWQRPDATDAIQSPPGAPARPSLGGSVVVVADDAGNFPGAVFVLPQMNELAFAHSFGIVMPGVVEAVNAHPHCSIALHGVDLEGSWDQFAGHLAADILLDGVGQSGFAEGDSALIVIKLHIVGNERGKLFQVAAVISVEKGSVERGDGLIEFRLRLNAIERRDGLGVGPDAAQRE